MFADVAAPSPPTMAEDPAFLAAVLGVVQKVDQQVTLRWTPRHGWDGAVACYTLAYAPATATARNSANQALANVADACERAGMWPENDGRSVEVYRSRRDASL